MTSLLFRSRTAFLTSILLTLIATLSFSDSTSGKTRSTKQSEATKLGSLAVANRGSKLHSKDTSPKAKLADKPRSVFNVRPRVENRSAKLSKAQLRLEQKRREAQRRGELQRLAALKAAAAARQRQRDAALRDQVQSLIAKDDLSGEDPEVRRAAVAALGNHAGTVVVMNPQTGRVYSLVNQQWALHEGFKPCSTIKLVTGLAGLNEKVIDQSDTTKISDSNQLSLTRALAYSKNYYFQQVGEQVGFDKMVSYARRLGLGEKTGINTNNESQGTVPGPASRSALSRMWSHGDNFQVTPIQLATLVSAIANGGKLLSPRIARTKQEELNYKTKVRRQVKMDKATWQQMIPGMVGSVSYGSGKRAHDPSETVAGKTGTCIENGTWVGLFTSYAPLANPRLAIVVIARGADAHNHFPAAVAGRIYRDLSSRFGTPANLQLAGTRTPMAADKTDSDDEEEDETTAMSGTWNEANNIGGINRARGAQTAIGKTGTAATNKVTPVLMQIPRRQQETVRPTVKPKPNPSPSNTSEAETRPRRVFAQ